MMKTNKAQVESLCLASVIALGTLVAASLPASAQGNNQNTPATNPAGAAGAVGQVGNAANGATNGAANAANGAVNTAGNVVNGAVGQVPGVLGQANQTVGQLGNTVGDVANGLQPTLQPVGQGVGSALNNLTQPDTVRSLLDFLSSVIPNHIEAHVNLDALRVDKVTLDIRGVDLRNLRVDLLVANSKNGPVQAVMGSGNNSGNMMSGNNGYNGSYGNNGYGNGGYGNGAYGTGNTQPSSGNNLPLPGNVPITGSSSRGR